MDGARRGSGASFGPFRRCTTPPQSPRPVGPPGPPSRGAPPPPRCPKPPPAPAAERGAAGLTIRWDARTTSVLEAPPVAGDREEARLALARTFFRSLGPADTAGFRRWAGVTRDDAAATVAALQPELVAVEVAGQHRWIL